MDYECTSLGDSALLLRFGGGDALLVNAQVHQALAQLRAADIPGVRSLAPSYAALLVTLDLAVVVQNGGSKALQQRIEQVVQMMAACVSTIARTIEVPVQYGGTNGPDLPDVAQALGMRVEDVIATHADAIYQVAMVGFLPGFPYLLGLPETLRLPRRSSVRTRVPAGSVAIAGAQAGIYPSVSPGGWHLIGRTDMCLFDVNQSSPAVLQPGDQLRFVVVP